MSYKMLDLFSGLGGASQAMEEDPNWEVTTVDFKERFEPDICKDVMDLTPEDFDDRYDLIWASPPCVVFSVASAWKDYWAETNPIPIPKKKKAVKHTELVYQTLWLINGLDPEWWFLENPRGMLRKVIGPPSGTVTYCQFGHYLMKPTDLWGEHPPSFGYRMCSPADDCHVDSPRGFGSMRDHIRDPAERAKVPYGLSKAVKGSVESPESKSKLEAFA